MLEGKVAIITGGTRGIGFATVQKFLSEKASVVLFGSKKESVEKALASLKEKDPDCKVEGYYPDITKEEEIKEVMSIIMEKYGKIDILVNNAGVSSSTPLDQYKEDDYNKIMDVNVKAMFLCSKEVANHMKEKGGVILNTSSMVSFYGQASGSLYPISKFAVNGLTKSLARELGKYHIRVNAVAPGITETDMVKALPKEMIEPLIQRIPLGRVGKAEDIANAFAFLASEQASYITGTILQVDGAMMS